MLRLSRLLCGRTRKFLEWWRTRESRPVSRNYPTMASRPATWSVSLYRRSIRVKSTLSVCFQGVFKYFYTIIKPLSGCQIERKRARIIAWQAFKITVRTALLSKKLENFTLTWQIDVTNTFSYLPVNHLSKNCYSCSLLMNRPAAQEASVKMTSPADSLKTIFCESWTTNALSAMRRRVPCSSSLLTWIVFWRKLILTFPTMFKLQHRPRLSACKVIKKHKITRKKSSVFFLFFKIKPVIFGN